MRARPDEPLATWCEARLDCCTGRATERHHRKFRSRGGTDDPANLIDLCGTCHRYVHGHDRWARTVGLSISRHSPDPTEPWSPDELEHAA